MASTGRYQWSQLYKTEKTHAGTLVEINLRREFKDFIVDGEKLDYRVAGIDVDCKFSQGEFGWMFPPEAIGEICLVMWASDEQAQWSMGLLRITESVLSTGRGNRDGKRTLLAEHRERINPIATRAVLPGNVYLSLPQSTVQHILDEKASGQERINRLFRSAQGKLIGRGAIATAGQQDDFMKRVRENGGRDLDCNPRASSSSATSITRSRRRSTSDPSEGPMVSATVVPAPKAPQTRRRSTARAGWSATRWSDPRLAFPARPLPPRSVDPDAAPRPCVGHSLTSLEGGSHRSWPCRAWDGRMALR
nr:restriction endonuclease [Deltaproteobacteria bacterium]